MDFEVVQGDIAEQSADVLVDEADTGLGVSGGIGVSLWRAAGRELVEDAIQHGPVGLGQVVVTSAYGLDAEYVIHAAVMPNYGDRKATAESIERATQHALEAADEQECESLVIPALGCGVGDFDLAEGAEIICRVIWEYEPETLSDVRVIAFKNDEYDLVKDVAARVKE